MSPEVHIRPEEPGDADTVDELVRRTYADVPYSDHGEHRMVALLRASDAFVPELSLIAEVDGEPAGHVLLTRAHIRNGAHRVETLALAPLSVLPHHRGRGVGRALVATAHDRARALGYASIVVVGLPKYFPPLGYEPLARYPIELPFDAPDPNRMILPLHPGSLDGVSGVVEYPAA